TDPKLQVIVVPDFFFGPPQWVDGLLLESSLLCTTDVRAKSPAWPTATVVPSRPTRRHVGAPVRSSTVRFSCPMGTTRISCSTRSRIYLGHTYQTKSLKHYIM